MLALQAWRQSRCPGCGGDLNVTADPQHEERYRYRPPVECWRCQAFAQSHEAFKEHPHAPLLIHQVPLEPGGS